MLQTTPSKTFRLPYRIKFATIGDNERRQEQRQSCAEASATGSVASARQRPGAGAVEDRRLRELAGRGGGSGAGEEAAGRLAEKMKARRTNAKDVPATFSGRHAHLLFGVNATTQDLGLEPQLLAAGPAVAAQQSTALCFLLSEQVYLSHSCF